MKDMTDRVYEGNAVVYCQQAFATTYGKTAHGLVRFSARYRIVCVIDADLAGRDAGEYLDGIPAGIPILSSVEEAVRHSESIGLPATVMIIGLATDGGVIDDQMVTAAEQALCAGLDLVSGLHQWFSDMPKLSALIRGTSQTIRDIRRTPPFDQLHFFSGKIAEVTSVKIAVLGTDSAIGKRTTVWKIAEALKHRGITVEVIGTGQTAWLQGARYSLLLDALINDFVSGEIEHVIHQAWKDSHPQVILIEGQGSLMNPGYPGGFELLAAGRPDAVFLQHAPARTEYDGFPGFPLDPLDVQIAAIELISKRPVRAVTINHEGLTGSEISQITAEIEQQTSLVTVDPLIQGCDRLVTLIAGMLTEQEGVLV